MSGNESGQLRGIPSFQTFADLIAQNIEVMPDVRLDEKGFTHRTQIFRDPLGERTRVLFSKRAIASYKAKFDIINSATARKSEDYLCDGACLLLGRTLLLSNRIAGLALIAQAFTKIRVEYMREEAIFAYLLESLREDDQAATVSFFLPLAHEIGHLAKSQALRPKDLNREKFLDTYRINYKYIWPIIGDLEYLGSQNDKESPLYLDLLMEEVTADWFAVTAVLSLIAPRNNNREFRHLDVFANFAMFPLVYAFDETCLQEWKSTKFVQEALLANQCRFSILIDSMRAGAKYLFPMHHDEIDEAILQVRNFYTEVIQRIWNAAIKLRALSGEMMKLSDVEVATYVREKTPREQWRYLHAYLAAVLDDSTGFALFEINRSKLRQIFDTMIHFDTGIITEDGIILIPKTKESLSASENATSLAKDVDQLPSGCPDLPKAPEPLTLVSRLLKRISTLFS